MSTPNDVRGLEDFEPLERALVALYKAIENAPAPAEAEKLAKR